MRDLFAGTQIVPHMFGIFWASPVGLDSFILNQHGNLGNTQI